MAQARSDLQKGQTAMKLTTLRLSHDLWRWLESEAELVGTSVSQYMREAALTRAAAAAAARGENPFEHLAATPHALADLAARMRAESTPEPDNAVLRRAHAARADAQTAREESHVVRDDISAPTREGARALRAESRQAMSKHSKRGKRA